MRRLPKPLLSTLLSALTLSAFAQYRTPSYGELYESDASAELRRCVEYLASPLLEGRAAGSRGEKEAAIYLSSELEKSGIDVLSGKEGEVFGVKLPQGDTLVSRNVVGYIPGYDKTLKERYIVIGARLDGPGTRVMTRNGEEVSVLFPGANGNASGVAMLLKLARTLQTNSVLLPRSVLIVGFGASLGQQAGAWYFLNRSFPDAGKIDAMINLDMVGSGGGFYAWCASNPDLTNALKALSSTLQPAKPEIITQEPVASDHRAFYDKKIPAVFFTSGMYREYNTPQDTPSIVSYESMERMSEYIYHFALSLSTGTAPRFDSGEEVKKADEQLRQSGVVPYYECDWKPSFLGSTDPKVFLQKWVYVYLRYPQECVREGVHGRVLVDFVIDERGKVRDVKVLKGVDPRLDEEAVRVISASPDWKPGRVRGKKVRAGMSLYVEFRLEKKKK